MADEIAEKLVRVSVPKLDEILGQKFPVLDKGFIRVVDYMGGDPSIVQAARTSYGKGTKKISEDEGLIRFLLRHSHSTPFEMCQLKIHVKVPMDCWRQWIRHRMSSTNEYSTRYSEAIDDKQTTAPDAWRLQSTTNKQGSSSGCVEEWPDGMKVPEEMYNVSPELRTPGSYLSRQEAWFHREAAQLYQERLKFGVAKEVARKDLPLSTYTEAYWCIDLHNLMHFLSLRMDTHAQLEIRSFANILGEIVGRWCPMAWAAFNDYNFRRHALLLSRRDKVVINCINQNDKEEAFRQASEFGWLDRREDGAFKDNRERAEFEKKLYQLSMKCPWAH
jgi:thymidylate synthase (FAD)